MARLKWRLEIRLFGLGRVKNDPGLGLGRAIPKEFPVWHWPYLRLQGRLYVGCGILSLDAAGLTMASQRIQAPAAILLTPPLPVTLKEHEAIREQLERILSSSVFRNSKRYASVLRYIVEQKLEGTASQLKERTIGIEVFGRHPDYDTGADHVVRSAATEIRKRLAQYYQEDGNSNELRIEVQPGSYVPQFRWPLDQTFLSPEDPIEPADLSSETHPILSEGERFGVRILGHPKLIISAGLVLLASLAAFLFFARPSSPFEMFWRPILSSQGAVQLCIGNLEGGYHSSGEHPDSSEPLTMRDFHRSVSQTVHVYDAITLAKFAGLLHGKGKQYHIASQSDMTFTDLQSGSAVMVGLMNNDWTERLISGLRFTVERPGHGRVIIRDRTNPLNNDWSMDYSTPYLDVTKDYALVIRVMDPKTEQMVVVAAGISVFGTFAAGEFLTNENEIKKLAAVVPKGWEQRNLEIVLSTDVIRGRPGHATIVATYFW